MANGEDEDWDTATDSSDPPTTDEDWKTLFPEPTVSQSMAATSEAMAAALAPPTDHDADAEEEDDEEAEPTDHDFVPTRSNREGVEAERDEEFRPLELDLTPWLQALALRPEKVSSETVGGSRQALSTLCVSQYRVGRVLARGSRAAIVEGCSPDLALPCTTVLRLALLLDEEENAARQLENQENFRQFLRDVEIRRWLADCAAQPAFVPLLDVFVCQQRFGVEVMPRLAGNLLDLLYETPSDRLDDVLDEVSRQVRRAVERLHACRVVHRDLGFQNVLYTGSWQQFEVFLTDFELAFASPPDRERSTEQDRAFDGYRHSDELSLHKMQRELRDFGHLLQALRAKERPRTLELWDHVLNAFLKSALEQTHPDVRQHIIQLRDTLSS